MPDLKVVKKCTKSGCEDVTHLEASLACHMCGTAFAVTPKNSDGTDRTFTMSEVQDIVDLAWQKKIAELVVKGRLPGGTDNGVAGSDAPSSKPIYRCLPTGRHTPFGGVEKSIHWDRTGQELDEFCKEYRQAIRHGVARRFCTEDLINKEINEGDNPSGGFLIPGEFVSAIMEKSVTDSFFLQFGMTIPMAQDTVSWPILNQTFGSVPDYYSGISWEYVGEGKLINESVNPSFRLAQLKARKVVGMQITSAEMMADRPDFASFLTNLVGRSFGYHSDEMVWRGDGIKQPLGFLTNPDKVTVTRDTTSDFVLADLIHMDQALDEAFSNPTIFLRKATALQLPLEQASGSGEPMVKPLYLDPSQAFKPPVLIGYPVVRTKHAAVLGAEGDCVLNDPSAIAIGLRKSLEVATSSDFLFSTDQLAIRWIARWDVRHIYPEATQILAA